MKNILKKWVKNEEAATAVEFSLAAVPLIFMTIGLIEMSMMYTASSLLEKATGTAARLVRTGQIQNGGGQTMFETALCESADMLMNCGSIQYEVITIDSGDFGDTEDFSPSFDGDGNLVPAGFSPGDENEVVLVRVVYRYPVLTPMIQPLLADAGTSRTLMATSIIKNEPFGAS